MRFLRASSARPLSKTSEHCVRKAPVLKHFLERKISHRSTYKQWGVCHKKGRQEKDEEGGYVLLLASYVLDSLPESFFHKKNINNLHDFTMPFLK